MAFLSGERQFSRDSVSWWSSCSISSRTARCTQRERHDGHFLQRLWPAEASLYWHSIWKTSVFIHGLPLIRIFNKPSHISQIYHQQFIKNMSIYKLWVLSPHFLSHSPSPPSICHSPGTEGVLLALRLGPGGGLPKLDQRGKIPSRWVGMWGRCTTLYHIKKL
jgi:hypothetical protein